MAVTDAWQQAMRWSRARLVLVSAAVTLLCFALAFAGLWIVAGEPAAEGPVAVADIGPPPERIDRLGYLRDGDTLVVRPSTADTFADLPPLPPALPLPPAPDAALLQPGAEGRLPAIGSDGRLPRRVYARSFERGDDRARIVLIVSGIGLAEAASRAAIERLPADVVLAIDAYAPDPDQWARWARRAGHEVLATLPFEAGVAAHGDAGPAALRAAMPAEESTALLERRLITIAGAIGVLISGGSAFGATAREPVLATLQTRGLLLVDAAGPAASAPTHLQQAVGPPVVRGDVVIDEATPGAAAIDRQLAGLATLARERFIGVGLVRAEPLILKRLRAWIDRLPADRYVLAPVSAVIASEEEQ